MNRRQAIITVGSLSLAGVFRSGRVQSKVQSELSESEKGDVTGIRIPVCVTPAKDALRNVNCISATLRASRNKQGELVWGYYLTDSERKQS